MKERTIMVFPKISDIEIIEEIRMKYDPLYSLVKPHITIVFPFKSELTKEEINKILNKNLKEIGPFDIEFKGISKHKGIDGYYLFLDMIKGKEKFYEINKKLYEGKLEKYKANLPYEPHITIGIFKNENECHCAYEKVKDIHQIFKTKVDIISVEIIGNKDESIIEQEVKLIDY